MPAQAQRDRLQPRRRDLHHPLRSVSRLTDKLIRRPKRLSYREATAIFRIGRAKGFSLTTIDTLIAAMALDHRAVLFTVDQDFSRIARITRLQLHSNY
jgi:predicted nucleic acid-binding protein